MVDLDEFDLEAVAYSYGIPGENHMSVGVFNAVLGKLQVEYPKRKPVGIYRHFYLLKQIRNGSDMVLVTVGDKQSAEFRRIAYDIGEIGDYKVDSGHAVLGKGHTAIDGDKVVSVLEYRHVHSDSVHSAYGDYLKFCGAVFSDGAALRCRFARAQLLRFRNGSFFCRIRCAPAGFLLFFIRLRLTVRRRRFTVRVSVLFFASGQYRSKRTGDSAVIFAVFVFCHYISFQKMIVLNRILHAHNYPFILWCNFRILSRII